MSRAQIVTVEPSLVSSRSSSHSSSSRPSRRAAHLIDRLNELEHEKRSRRHTSQAGALVVHNSHHETRHLHDINADIRALEAEQQARAYDSRAAEERQLAHSLRERSLSRSSRSRYGSSVGGDKAVVTVERDYYTHPPHSHGRELLKRRISYEEFQHVSSARSRAPPQDLILYDPEKYGPREVVYRRAPTPPRNVVRVQKDRKGRLALVRSTR